MNKTHLVCEAQFTLDARHKGKQMEPVVVNGSVYTAKKLPTNVRARVQCVDWA